MRQVLQDAVLECDHGRRRLLAGFDARLMVGIDMDQRRVQPDRPLEQRNELPHAFRIHSVQGDRDRFSVVFEQGSARALQEPAQIVSARHARIHLHGASRAVLKDLDEDHEKIVDPLPQLLHISMLVR